MKNQIQGVLNYREVLLTHVAEEFQNKDDDQARFN